jgi:integrase/recombinase XerD
MELCVANETRALTALGGARTGDLPGLVVAGGPAAEFAWEEFLFGRIRNEHTRRAYGRAVGRFLAWCEGRGLDLPRIAPRDVGVYLDLLPGSAPTKKLHLAALRHFFDQLVTRHAVILNPAASVRAQRYQMVESKTPEIYSPSHMTLHFC